MYTDFHIRGRIPSMSGHLSVYSLYTGKIRGIMNGAWKENILMSYISRIITSGFHCMPQLHANLFSVSLSLGLLELKVFPS